MVPQEKRNLKLWQINIGTNILKRGKSDTLNQNKFLLCRALRTIIPPSNHFSTFFFPKLLERVNFLWQDLMSYLQSQTQKTKLSKENISAKDMQVLTLRQKQLERSQHFIPYLSQNPKTKSF